MVSGGPVYSDHGSPRGMYGKSVGSRSMPSSWSSASEVEVRQRSKPDKSAIASILGLCISNEAFRAREKDFQTAVYESVSMEAAHKEYVSTRKGAVSRGEIDAMSTGDLSEMDPDVVRRAAFYHEGSKALQAIIMSHDNTPFPPTWARSPPTGTMPPQDTALEEEDYQAIGRIYDLLSDDIVFMLGRVWELYSAVFTDGSIPRGGTAAG
eukprot:jgi/Picre1/32778/NNA_008109.t1